MNYQNSMLDNQSNSNEFQNYDIVVYLGANTSKLLMDDILGINSNIGFIASSLYDENIFNRFKNTQYMKSIINFDDGMHSDSGTIELTNIDNFNNFSVIDKVLNDKNLPLLWSRFGSKIRNTNDIDRHEASYSLIKSAIKTLICRNVKTIVFSYEPHNLPIYILKKVAIELKISTLTMAISPFSWRMFCVASDNSIFYNKALEGHKISKSVQILIKEKQSDYEIAKPFYEKRIQKDNIIKKYLNLAQINNWHPLRFFLGLYGKKNLDSLSIDRKSIYKTKYISFFLQYQPEQTTLPDGGIFSNQLIALQALYSAASKMGYSVVVREHPATFESVFDYRWRSVNFYKKINKIGEKIFLDKLSNNPYDLINNSAAVASITGTVLLESLLLGKPAIAFGNHPLKGFDNKALIDNFTDEKELMNKMKEALDINHKNIVESASEYLNNAYYKTFGEESDYCGNSKMSLDKLRVFRNNAMKGVIKKLN